MSFIDSPRLDRRSFLAGSALALACARLEGATGSPDIVIYIGTYTEKGSKGIYRAQLDTRSGELSAPALAVETKDPSFLAFHPKKPFLYAVNETVGKVSAFGLPDGEGLLRPINQQSSEGSGPCHLTLDHTGHMLVVANYNNGSFASYRVKADGSLSAPVASIQFSGSGPDHTRQEGPHAHCAVVTPDNRNVLINDLGTDRTMIYHIHPETAAVEASDPPFAAANPGVGPRHLAFDPAHRFVYVVNEMGSSVTRFRFDAARPTLTKMDTVSTLPADYHGGNTAAEIEFSRDGHFLYVSNRGHDSLAVFDVGGDGALKAAQHVSCGGKTPRSFALCPSGRWLVAANQDSDNLVVLKVDARTGRLTETGKSVALSTPVCVLPGL